VTLAAPGFLAAAFAVAAAVTALHLLVLRPPPASRLPTARFVPPAPSVVRRRETWPQDRWLLALRIATILCAGLAFAGPAFGGRRVHAARIVAVDLSAPSAHDSATRYLRASDILIAFDTAARVLPAESLGALGSPGRTSSLSSALIAARRAAAHLSADSIELVVISPFTESERDVATAAIARQWPAAIRTIRVAAPSAPARHAAVHWSVPVGAVDTVGAVATDAIVAVAPFTRSRAYHAPEGAVVARWVDGVTAAAERPLGDSCERDIAIGMPESREADRLRSALTDRPCGGAVDTVPMSDSALRAFADSGAYGATFGPSRGGAGDRTLMSVLLVLACAMAIAEWVIRR
jgi:hypothetical protein